MIRARGVPSPALPDSACVEVLMLVTVEPKWSTDKVQYHGDSVVRFGSGAAAAARPGPRRGAALPAGERLPSSGELAHELGVSRGLVQECYRQLLSEGYLTSQLGSATRVATGAY